MAAGTGIMDMDTRLPSVRGAITTTLLTRVLPTAITDLAGLSAASSSAPALGTTDTGDAAATTDAAATDMAVQVTVMVAAADTDMVAVELATLAPVTASLVVALAMQAVDVATRAAVYTQTSAVGAVASMAAVEAVEDSTAAAAAGTVVVVDIGKLTAI